MENNDNIYSLEKHREKKQEKQEKQEKQKPETKENPSQEKNSYIPSKDFFENLSIYLNSNPYIAKGYVFGMYVALANAYEDILRQESDGYTLTTWETSIKDRFPEFFIEAKEALDEVSKLNSNPKQPGE